MATDSHKAYVRLSEEHSHLPTHPPFLLRVRDDLHLVYTQINALDIEVPESHYSIALRSQWH
jgi:hypothetical protein